MLKYEVEAIKEEAVAHNIRCEVKSSDNVYWVSLGEKKKPWLSYFYAIMDLWELEYKQEGISI